jgi:hypothetical protein
LPYLSISLTIWRIEALLLQVFLRVNVVDITGWRNGQGDYQWCRMPEFVVARFIAPKQEPLMVQLQTFRVDAEVGPYIHNYWKNVGAMLCHRP